MNVASKCPKLFGTCFFFKSGINGNVPCWILNPWEIQHNWLISDNFDIQESVNMSIQMALSEHRSPQILW